MSNGAIAGSWRVSITPAIRRLRSEIEPVAARDFLRFLFAWQHVADDTRLEGPQALSSALTVLEGFEAPAAAWETEILPARLAGYEPAWLDGHCLAGRAMWARLTPPVSGKGRTRTAIPVRSTPIALLDRRRLSLWIAHLPQTRTTPPTSRAQLLLDCLHAHGALFFDELAEASHLLRPQVEEGSRRTRRAWACDLRQFCRAPWLVGTLKPAQADLRRQKARAGPALRY